MLTCASVNLLRRSSKISPAVEKTLSLAVLVPGIIKYFNANACNLGYNPLR
jgi:hypothetical protein